MKKFLFTSLISHDLGLITRSLPIACELRSRGHEVVFCHAGKAQCATITAAGFEIIPYEGPLYYLITGNVSLSVLYRVFRSGNLKRDLGYLVDLTKHLNRFSTAEVWNADHFEFLMGAFHAGMVRHAVDYWISVVRACNPDAVVDFWNSGACGAARFCGKPLITVIQAEQHPLSRGHIWWREPPPDIPSPVTVINQIRAEYHMPPLEKAAELFVGDKTLVVGMPETDPLPDTANVTYIGPVLWQKEPERLPEWFDKLKTTRPVIWLYPGNPQYMPGSRSYGDSLVVTTACISALKDKPVQVIYSGGHHPLPRQARPLPSNFRYVSYVPGLDMAARSDLMIHHGGYGSCQTGLFTGTPSLVIPTYSERESNARRVASVGAGDFVLPTTDPTGRMKRVDAAEVSAKVDQMLLDTSYKVNARKMSQKLKSYGGAVYAAQIIEDTVLNRKEEGWGSISATDQNQEMRKEEEIMAKIHKSIEIKAPLKEVFSYIQDPSTTPEWLVGMIEVHNITGSGVGRHFDWTYKMAGVPLKGENTVTEEIPEKRLVVESKGGAESTWTFNLERRKDVTVLDLDIDYKIPVPVLGKLADKLLLRRNERETEMDLLNIKEKLEAR